MGRILETQRQKPMSQVGKTMWDSLKRVKKQVLA